MKISFISDLHANRIPDCFQLMDQIRKKLFSINPDVFIIAGDVAASIRLFEQVLHTFACIPCPKLFVAGNHDIWIESSTMLRKGINSTVKYYELIPSICERNGFTCLGQCPCIIDGTGFAGTIGWYDYSLRNKKFDSLFSAQMYRSKNSMVT